MSSFGTIFSEIQFTISQRIKSKKNKQMNNILPLIEIHSIIPIKLYKTKSRIIHLRRRSDGACPGKLKHPFGITMR